MSAPTRFSIGYISLQTGLSPHLLRAWERRYQAITPRRSKSNRRLYSASDLQRLRLLKRAIQHGHRISTIANLGTAELATLAQVPPQLIDHRRESGAPERTDTRETVDACLRALAALDEGGLHHILQQSAVSFSHHMLLGGVIRPFMEAVGHRCAAGSLRIVHGQLAAVVVHSLLSWMLVAPDSESADRPCLMIATPAGQHCCLGAMAVALIARDEGWRAIYLGADLPAEEIAAASFMLGPQLLALSITASCDGQRVADELIRLVDILNHSSPMVIGGRASDDLRDHGAIASAAVWADTEDLIGMLQSQTPLSGPSSLSRNASNDHVE